MNEDTNTWKTRLLYEYRNLLIAVTKLDAFINLNQGMDEKEYKLICEQREVMKRYEEVLSMRLEKALNS